MKKGWIVAIGVVAFIVICAIIALTSLVGFRNTAIDLEERIKAQHTANKSNYDNMWKSFVEASQVTEKQAQEFKEIYDGLIAGRYEGDSEVLFKAVQEQNPNINTDLYVKLQNMIESGRKEFDNNQKKITDIIREYNTYIRKHFISNAILNFKELDANDYIVTSQRTTNAFESGEDEAVNLNGK